jgi:pentapeptide MXKDX repeat protein
VADQTGRTIHSLIKKEENTMTKLLSALVAAFFAVASVTPVAFAQDTKKSEEKKSEKSKGDAMKAEKSKAGEMKAEKSKGDEKKASADEKKAAKKEATK